jgi:hypothetical protein
MAIAFGVAPPERWQSILTCILDEARLVLTRTGDSDPDQICIDEESRVTMAQPFACHHLHRALSRAGRTQDLLDNIRRRWGPWVAAGEPTFWELWRLGDQATTCHAWSATPTFDLSTEVLGIAPIAPGFASFRVAPKPGDLDWAEGAFPCPHGDIRVRWQRGQAYFDLTLSVPANAMADVQLPSPESGNTWAQVKVDGLATTQMGAALGPGTHHIVATL